MTDTAPDFYPPNVTSEGFSYAINSTGTAVQLNFPSLTLPLTLTGTQALALRSWLDAAALRTPEEAAALEAPPAPA